VGGSGHNDIKASTESDSIEVKPDLGESEVRPWALSNAEGA